MLPLIEICSWLLYIVAVYYTVKCAVNFTVEWIVQYYLPCIMYTVYCTVHFILCLTVQWQHSGLPILSVTLLFLTPVQYSDNFIVLLNIHSRVNCNLEYTVHFIVHYGVHCTVNCTLWSLLHKRQMAGWCGLWEKSPPFASQLDVCVDLSV